MTKTVFIDGVEYVPKTKNISLRIDGVEANYDRENIRIGSQSAIASVVVGAEYMAQVAFNGSNYKLRIPSALFDEIVNEAKNNLIK